MNNTIFLLARIIMMAIFVRSGINHLTKEAIVGYAQFKKIPNAQFAVRISGVLYLAGSIGIIFGVWGDLAALLTALLLLIVTITMHNFWTLEDAAAKATDQLMFMKNVSMIGGLLGLAWAFSNGGGITLTDAIWPAG
ncbi:MAG: DoxX family protein [Ilumatobacteraceae bacterium]